MIRKSSFNVLSLEKKKMKNRVVDVRIQPTYRISQRVAKDNEVCKRASRGWESTTRMRISRLGQIEDRRLDCIP